MINESFHRFFCVVNSSFIQDCGRILNNEIS